jgi:hypothetical protein
MCSTPSDRISEIGQAIDELAMEAEAAYARAENQDPAAIGHADQVVIRLAQLWARLAELDPEVARRLPTYQD